jgi:hypothetical protein
MATLTANSSGTHDDALNPPHGLKGVLNVEPIITPEGVMNLGFFVLFCVIMLMAVVRLFKKIKSFRHKNPPGAVSKESWNGSSLLTQINSVALPRKDYTSEVEEKADWARFSSAVSIILRRSVEVQTKRPVAERTTKEIYSMFESTDVSLGITSKDELIALLTRLDDITFAGRVASLSEASDMLTKVKAIVKGLIEGDLNQTERSRSQGEGVQIFE